jgi:DNA-binding transcriptional ArsR family regulator
LLLKEMGNETRFNIIEFLLDGEKCVCEITPRVGRAQPTVSLQLKRLEKAGVVGRRKDGKKAFYSIKNPRAYDVFRALGHKGKILKKTCCTEVQ